MLDGLQNILPAHVSASTQNTFSCLLDAYKLNELQPQTGLGIFTLNSTLTDLAEPSESLLASTVFQTGLPQVNHLLSSSQLDAFRAGGPLSPETHIRGFRGAYFIHTAFEIAPGQSRSWYFAADTPKDAAEVVALLDTLKADPLELQAQIEQDIQSNEANLLKLAASADGLQLSADSQRMAHHLANVIFNSMRGGVFADQYRLSKADFLAYVKTHNHQAAAEQAGFFAGLPDKIHISDFYALLDGQNSPDLARLGYTYLPLTFSRRHGDPSRPWNKFAIDIQEPDGSVKLNYEGNWRDIFQNWEALAYSFPEFVEAMLSTFLSATTADGYNPYRISRDGLDWEIPEPGNPWANIGYWGDHQIIYLQKLMELSQKVHPNRLNAFLLRPIFSYANIPYRIKPYDELLQDPYNTIDFDYELNESITQKVKSVGTDARLLQAPDGAVIHGSLTEKLLTLLLAKLVNFVPEGGIWMNTQRPEWNDANNALVGKGLSVVTLGYLRRFVRFCLQLFSQSSSAEFELSPALSQLFSEIASVLLTFQNNLSTSFTDAQRRSIMDALGSAGSHYRNSVYTEGLTTQRVPLSKADLLGFLQLTLNYIDHSLSTNRRPDHLFHTYNTLSLGERTASIGHLQEMLEGQVAILSSELLTAGESLALLQSLRNSALYRPDQNTYILYPDRTLPDFLSKNTLTPTQVQSLRLPPLLAEKGDKSLLLRDLKSEYHFSGSIHNIKDVHSALDALLKNPDFAQTVAAERDQIAELFESVFHHRQFTGRSSTFFAYEGLGSVYWHMVSKLLLAAQETALRHANTPESAELTAKYHQICAGFGFTKDAKTFGAFPTDPYSHTPQGQGARQPGMTGSVKEEIIARLAELGLLIEDGCLKFSKLLINPDEFLQTPAVFRCLDINHTPREIALPTGSLAFTFCQVPVVIHQDGPVPVSLHQDAQVPVGVHQDSQDYLKLFFTDGTTTVLPGSHLDPIQTAHIFHRNGTIHHLEVHLR